MLQPVLCITPAVEPLSWTGLPVILVHRTRRRWAEVPPQRQRASPVLSGLERAMDIWTVPTGSIEKLPQPIHPIPGSMRRTVSIAPTARGSFVAEVQGMRLHGRIRSRRLGPCPPSPYARGKSACARGVVRLPHPLLALRTDRAQGFRGPVTAGEQGMEKTAEHREVGTQSRPGAWGGLPAVRRHRVWGILLLQACGVVGKGARGLLHVRWRRR